MVVVVCVALPTQGSGKNFSITVLLAQTVQPWILESIPQKTVLKSSDDDNLAIALIHEHDALFLDVWEVLL